MSNGNAFEFFKLQSNTSSPFNKVTLFTRVHHIIHLYSFIMPKVTFIHFCQCSSFPKMANLIMQIHDDLSSFIRPCYNKLKYVGISSSSIPSASTMNKWFNNPWFLSCCKTMDPHLRTFPPYPNGCINRLQHLVILEFIGHIFIFFNNINRVSTKCIEIHVFRPCSM